MACFMVPAAEAVVSAAVSKYMQKKGKTVCSEHLSVLSNMLFGASLLSACEHVYHGEIISTFPFLTALQNPESTRMMWYEMMTEGMAMAIAVTAVWCVWLFWKSRKEKKLETEEV